MSRVSQLVLIASVAAAGCYGSSGDSADGGDLDAAMADMRLDAGTDADLGSDDSGRPTDLSIDAAGDAVRACLRQRRPGAGPRARRRAHPPNQAACYTLVAL